MHIEEKAPTATSEVFTVHFPVSELDKYVHTFIEARSKTFKKDGFRPGKVPLDVVRMHHLADAQEWAEEQLARQGWDVLRKKYADKQWAGFNSFAFDKNDPATIKIDITCEVWPKLAIADQALPSFEQVKVGVSDKTIKEWIPAMLKHLIVYEPRDKDYAIAKNDLVKVNLFFRHKGKEISDSRIAGSYVELNDSFIASFRDIPFAGLLDKLIGAKAGDVVKQEFKATKNYCWQQRKLVGERIECEGRIVAVEQHKEKPTEKDLAERFGVKESELVGYIQQGFQDYASLLEAMHNKRMIFDHLDSVFNFEVVDRRWQEEAKRIAYAYDADGTDKESEEIAKRRVRLGIIVEQLRGECGTLTAETINKGVELYALTHQLDPVVVMRWIQRVGHAVDKLPERAQADWNNIMGAVNEWNVANYVVGKMKSKAKDADWAECQKKWSDVLPPHFLEDESPIRYILTMKQRKEVFPSADGKEGKEKELAE